MRNDFFKRLHEHFADNTDTYLLTGDLGFVLFDPFRDTDPKRFIDAGAAEANMVGTAAGLALSGKKVVCYSITPFLTMRAFEQVRLNLALHNADVKLVTVGGGFTYGFEGYTHFGFEDLALMASLPNMRTFAPADTTDAVNLADWCMQDNGPAYIRLGRQAEESIYELETPFLSGKAVHLRKGTDGLIIATGSMVQSALQAREILSEEGIDAGVLYVHTLSPFDSEGVAEIAGRYPAVVTAEEHNLLGGLGSQAAQALLEAGKAPRFKMIGIENYDRNLIGDAEYLRERYGLSGTNIAETLKKLIIK
ncbi:transketolase family protein [Limisalsivibrio acetivorans]|uniref:transketolase family protein n=1 Tax=Limisalsivibrio acetivorans TaxID=1304888 RepID=UPI0003B42723|nr:transketolase C-terminal domain-containing protein [Limisalsivibrio acetivorans]